MIDDLKLQIKTLVEEKSTLHEQVKTITQKYDKLNEESRKEKISWKEKEVSARTQSAKLRTKVQVLQSELQKALCQKEEARSAIQELEVLIKDIHPNEMERMRATARIEVKKDRDRQELRRLEQLLAESEETEKLHLEEKRILREEMEFLRKTLLSQQSSPLSIEPPTPTSHLHQPQMPPPPPQRQTMTFEANDVLVWVCWGGRKAKLGLSEQNDVDDLRTLACRSFSLENSSLYDLFQTTFLDPSAPITSISQSTMVFLIHSDSRLAYGDEDCVRIAEEKVRNAVKGHIEGNMNEPLALPKLILPPTFSIPKGFLTTLAPPPPTLMAIQWPTPPFKDALSAPLFHNFVTEAPRAPRLPKWLEDAEWDDTEEQHTERISHLKKLLFQLQILLKNSEDCEQVHVEQERTLRLEIELLKKEIEVLKYESDFDLPCLRNCVMRLLMCSRLQEMEQLLPVIANMLQCTPSDVERVKKVWEARKSSVMVFGVEVLAK
jgi:hypothetical protein